MSLLIKNGSIITSCRNFQADILINSGKIAGIGHHLIHQDTPVKIIDADGKYIFPGGIDPHVHMHLPTPAGFSSDDFYTGSRAALFGGTTSIIDFVTPQKGQSLVEALKMRQKEAGNSLADFSFHVSPVDFHQNIENEIKECVRQGVTSFKIYLAYKNTIGLEDENILKVLKTVGKLGGIVTAHCEMGDDIERLRNSFFENGQTSPMHHALSRPDVAEAEAVKKLIEMAAVADCPVYIVHVSAARSLEHIQKAQQKGQPVFAETCPHYLLLDDSKYSGIFEKTVPFVISPPLRQKQDQNALWKAINEGIIQTVGTDHCPFNFSQKAIGLNDFRKIPNGAGGIEHRMALLFTYGVLEKRISLEKFVEITSTNAARIFGIFPAKGQIAKGADADLVIWNPATENVISTKNHHQNCDINIFEGLKTLGSPEFVIKNGEVILENGVIVKDSAVNFLKRSPNRY